MPQQPGPFSAYLTEPAKQSSVPNPTGFEGQAGSIAHIGSKFLEGLRQGRLHRAAMAEMENSKTERAIEQAIHHVSSIEGVDPAVKQHYQNQLVQQYLGHIAGQKETSKDTGHPMTDMLKNIAISMSGGQMPTKAKPGLDLNLVGEAMTMLNDPANRVDQKLARLNADIQSALKSGNVTDIRTAYGNPAVTQYLNEGRRLSGKDDWVPDSFRSLAQDPFASAVESRKMGIMNRLNAPGQSTSGPTTTRPQWQNVFSFADAYNSAIEADSKLVGMPTGVPANVDKNWTTATWKGRDMPGRIKAVHGLPGYEDGMYDESGIKVNDYVVASPYNAGSDTQVITSKPTPESPEHFLRVSKRTGSVTPLADNSGNPVIRAANPSVALGTFTNTDGSQYQAPTTLFRQNTGRPAATGVTAPASTPVSSSAPPVGPAARPLSGTAPATVAPTSPSAGRRFSRQPTVSEAPVLQNEANQLRNWSIAVEDVSASKANPDEFRQIKNMAFGTNSGGYMMPTRRQLDKVSAAEKLANNIVPKIKDLMARTKGQGGAFAWANGKLVSLFPMADPELNALIGSINAEATPVATTIGGEVRATDSDAIRAMGGVPQAGKSSVANKMLLDMFQQSIYNAVRSAAAGAPDQQLYDIADARGGEFQSIIRNSHKPRTAPTGNNHGDPTSGNTPKPKLIGGRVNPFAAQGPTITIKAKP